MMHPTIERLLRLLFGIEGPEVLHDPEDRCPICHRTRRHDARLHRRAAVLGSLGITAAILALGFASWVLRVR